MKHIMTHIMTHIILIFELNCMYTEKTEKY